MKTKIIRLILLCNLRVSFTLHRFFRKRYIRAIHLCAKNGHANLV